MIHSFTFRVTEIKAQNLGNQYNNKILYLDASVSFPTFI